MANCPFSLYLTLPRKVLCLLCLSLIALPALGAALAGLPARYLLEFPPVTLFVRHEGFFWPACAALAVLTVASLLPFIAAAKNIRPEAQRLPSKSPRRLPAYGRAGLAIALFSWCIAWTRIGILAPVQHHTFFPLWLGFVLVANGTAERLGSAPLSAKPRRYFALFAISSFFWWYFEYLNRFAQNWSYQNVAEFSPLEYFLFATLSFSTVLPAVSAVSAILFQRQRLSAPYKHWIRVPWLCRSSALAAIGAVAALTLLLLPCFPNALFPFVWLAPTALVLVTLEACSGSSFLSQVARGDWSRVVVWALSALICGFFWEMWNWQSLARWVYHIPFVGRFYIFEMPILGFAGYLPFGVLCGAVIERVLGLESEQ